MSLKPLKKSDLGKTWMTGRKDRPRKIHPEYHLIVTEGTRTEPEYFSAIKERINARHRERIQMEIIGRGESTIRLFQYAKKAADSNPNGYRHIWIVYDADDFPREEINLVASLCEDSSAEDRTFHAIWSNQCVELWFLLHFSFMQSDIHRDEYAEKLSENLSALGKGAYRKNRTDMFEILEPYMETAIGFAKRLAESNRGKTPADSAPGTMVYQMLEAFRPYL